MTVPTDHRATARHGPAGADREAGDAAVPQERGSETPAGEHGKPLRKTYQWYASLPNLISVGRLVFVPIIIATILDRRWGDVFLLFMAAGLSDAVDGFVAKRFGLTSELGAYLDPLADKALLVSIFLALAFARVIPNWIAILVVSRDIMIVGAVLVAVVLGRPMTIRPLLISKANTTAQIAFAAGVIGARAFGIDLGAGLHVAMWVVAALTVASTGAYLATWLDHMSG